MAVRLQMKLGVVAEADRLEDSPDTVARRRADDRGDARSKGSLYLVVTSAVAGPGAREATRLVADTIQGEYYYDESAGIASASRRRSGRQQAAGHEPRAAGPRGRRGRPDRARRRRRPGQRALRHHGRARSRPTWSTRRPALTLPDPHRERGLPADDLAPRRLARRDRRRRHAGPRLAEHQAAARDRRAEGRHQHAPPAGGDGAGPPPLRGGRRHGQRRRDRDRGGRGLVDQPARPPRPGPPTRAAGGHPDRSPIPLADSVGGGVAAVSSGASRAASAAGSASDGAIPRLQDLLPRRGPATGG